MKHQDEIMQLQEWLAELGISVSREALSGALQHLDWVIQTNANLNLTAVVDRYSALRLHVLDSLSVLPEVNSAPSGLLVDIGTGGGFPGLPLSLASDRMAVLVDSVEKKAHAISGFVKAASFDEHVTTFAGRSEELARLRPGLAAVVVARAVAEAPVVMELAAPLLQNGGILVMLKGDPSDDEVARGRKAADILGYGEFSIRSFILPGAGEQRAVIRARMTAQTSLSLPRRPGMAKKRPVA